MPQHPLESLAIKLNDTLECALRCLVKTSLPGRGFLTQQLGAHHGREGQGDDSGDEDGDAEGNRKFPEQAPDNVSHEQQRYQYGN